MGKRKLNNKYYKEEENSDQEHEISENFLSVNELVLMLQKLNSSEQTEREYITSLLADHEFNPSDEKMRDQIVNSSFCQALVQRLDDPFIQIKYNSVLAIVNLIVTYSQYEIEKIFLFDSHLLTGIQNVFCKYLNDRSMNITEKYTEGESNKVNKLIKSTIDLLLLIVDIYDSESFNKLDFLQITKSLVLFILQPGSLSEDVIINSCVFLANLFSLRQFDYGKEKEFLDFIKFSKGIVSDSNSLKSANQVVVASFVTSLFYIYAQEIHKNFDTTKGFGYIQSDFEFVQYLIDLSYKGVNYELCEKMNELDTCLKNFIHSSSEKENSKEHSKNLKEISKNAEKAIRSTLLYLKTFTDVINSFEPEFSKTAGMEEEYEEDDDGEDTIITNNSVEPLIQSSNPHYKSLEDTVESSVKFVILKIFENQSKEKLINMLKSDFLPRLMNYFDKMKIEEFLLNDFDKMIVIKELLQDLEYFTLSIINNLIRNFEGIFENDIESLTNLTIIINRRLGLAEYSQNSDFLSVMLTCLHSILEKKKINIELQYKSLFIILNNNIHDSFVKINIIDIIALYFSLPGKLTKEDNEELCKLLLSLCTHEKDTECVAHVLNAFFDIYREDDYESNFVLKTVGVVEMMFQGISVYKLRINDSYQIGELDSESYEYCKEALLNLKRFVKYKKKLFNKLGIV